MSYEFFDPYNPTPDTKTVIRRACRIIQEYQADNLVLTLRQLYYQFVANALIENSDKSYKRLGNIIAKARMGGLLDWSAIEDRVRRPVEWAQHESAHAALEAALASFRLPRLQGQRCYVELWVEKDALAGVLEPLSAEYHVTLMVNRGYSSVSAMKAAADRIRACCQNYGSERAAILYLGDLDPSGEDMVRDIEERLGLFLNYGRLFHFGEDGITAETEDEAEERKPYIELDVTKLALTIDQVHEYDPPPNPAKLSDSRAKAFIEEYGYESWEVDALPPPVLREIIRQGFSDYMDLELLEEMREREDDERDEAREAIRDLI
jgi:hypothetical protein